MLPLRTILHPTDFSPHAGPAYRLARALARDYKARLVVLHVLPAPPFITPSERECLSAPVGSCRHKAWAKLRKLSRNCRLRQGRPASEIITVAKGVGCGLIVMGTHGSTGLRRALLGSVAEEVLRHAPCPVLTVRPGLPTLSPPRLRRS